MTRRKKMTLIGLGLLFVMLSRWMTTDSGPRWMRSLFTSPFLTISSSQAVSKTRPPSAQPKKTDESDLPIGLSQIESRAGSGDDQAVLKNGVWFPVYALHEKGPGKKLTRVPLSITSGSPPPGIVGQPYDFRFQAIGGSPPYVWSIKGLTPLPELSFDSATGRLFAEKAPLLKARPTVIVRDAEAATAAVEVPLIISPAEALTISTTDLPIGTLGELYRFTFTAQGGVPPYQWTINCPSLNTTSSPSAQWQLVPASVGEHDVIVTLTDAQQSSVEKTFPWMVSEGLIITTTSPLPAARPGEAYRFLLKASGGTPPYHWQIDHHDAVSVDENGLLTYQATAAESTISCQVTVSDQERRRFSKKLILPVRDRLLARASAEKIGLAWSPRDIATDLAQRGETLLQLTLSREGGPSYDALQQDNLVDRDGLVTGQTYRYDLIARTQGAEGLQTYSYTHANVTLLPMTKQRAEPGRTADPYADRVVSFTPLSPGGFGANQVPQNITGPPDFRANTYTPSASPLELASLHARQNGIGGTVVLEFTDNIVTLDRGLDLTVFENVFFVGKNPNKRFMEPALVSVALREGEWHQLPTDVVPPPADQPINFRDPFYYAEGFAGRNPTLGGDPTNPLVSGGDSFDLNTLPTAQNLRWIRFIKIQSTGDATQRDKNGDLIYHPNDPLFNPLSGTASSGFDLDAVSAVNY